MKPWRCKGCGRLLGYIRSSPFKLWIAIGNVSYIVTKRQVIAKHERCGKRSRILILDRQQNRCYNRKM